MSACVPVRQTHDLQIGMLKWVIVQSITLDRRLVGLLVAVNDTYHHDTRKRQWRLTAPGLHDRLLFA